MTLGRFEITVENDTLGTTLEGEEQGTDAHWDPKTYEVEDAAFGFVKFENGATVFLESSWALNTTDERQAMTTVYGTKAGAAMEFPAGQKGTGRVLRVNTVIHGRQAIFEPDVSENTKASGDLIFNYPGAQLEAETWLNALEGKGELVVKPYQAYTVTRILEAIYESAATGKTVYLEN